MSRVSQTRFRSVNIERDILRGGSLDDYVPLPDRMLRLQGILHGIRDGDDRALTLTGPCGIGKSKDLLLLASALSVTSPNHTHALKILGAAKSASKWEALAVTADPVTFRQQISLILSKLPGSESGKRSTPSSKSRNESGTAILLIVDELSRLLEEPTLRDQNLALLQDLAETIQRSSHRIVLIGALHRGFANYGVESGLVEDMEWIKVQGRFRDFPLSLSFRDGLTLLNPDSGRSSRRPSSAAQVLASTLLHSRRGDAEDLERRINGAWPLSPLTAVLLVCIARTGIGQSDRGIRDFQYQMEKGRAIQDGLSVLPWMLWSWVTENLGSALARSSLSHQWALATHCVERAGALGDRERKLVQTVALVRIFGSLDGLLANVDTLSQTADLEDVESLLQRLADARILTFREYRDTYDLYEGSDFQLSQVADLAPKITISSICEALTNLVDPCVAASHLHETGTLRLFKVQFIDSPEKLAKAAGDFPEADGRLLVHVRADTKDVDTKVAGHVSVTDAFSSIELSAALLRDIREWLGIEHVRRHHPALQSDAVARREVSQRLTPLVEQVRQTVMTRLVKAEWRLPGSRVAKTFETLAALTSAIAAVAYQDSPRLHNELLNRRGPSPNAVGARRTLCQQMLNAEGVELLGIEKFPAERGLYDCLLSRTGIHSNRIRQGTKVWAFGAPTPSADSCNIRPTWGAITRFLKESADEPKCFGPLFDLLSAPPYGLRAGVIPVIVLAVLLSERGRIAFYSEGSFVPELNMVWIEGLLRDPDMVAARFIKSPSNIEMAHKVLSRAVHDLGESVSEPEEQLKIVARYIHSMDPWVQRTQRLSPSTITWRDAFLSARDPIQLLQDQLPQLLERSPTKFSSLADALVELKSFLRLQLNTIDNHLRSAFCVADSADDAVVNVIRRRATTLKGALGDLRAEATVIRLATYSSDADWLESFAGFVVSKPIRGWVDRDLDVCLADLDVLIGKLLDTELYASRLSGSPQVIVRTASGQRRHVIGGDNVWTEKLPPEVLSGIDAAIGQLSTLMAGAPWAEVIVARVANALLTDQIPDAVTRPARRRASR